MKPEKIREMKKRLKPSDELINDTIGKIEEARSRRGGTAPQWKAAAAVALCCVIIAAGIFAVPYFMGNGIGDDTGVPGENETLGGDENIVLPPVRVSKNPEKGSIAFFPDILQEAENSVAIVRLRVKNWLGESENYEMTCFEAEIIEVYGGEIPDEIVLVQDGIAQLTIDRYPIFTYGNELFLMLEKIETRIKWYESMLPNVDYAEFDYENAYSIAGGPLNVWHVATSDSGEKYLIPQFVGTASQAKAKYGWSCLSNYGSASDSGITKDAVSAAINLVSLDSYAAGGYSPEYVFKLRDMVELLNEEIVLPPVRNSKNPVKASFMLGTLEEIEAEAVAIARLRIKNWLGESIQHKRTYFEAEVIDVYKGELPESIILTQGGTSEETVEGFPLFTYGKEVILYLYKRDPADCRYEDASLNVSESEWDVDNIYAMCSILYTMNVATLENKNEYIIPTISSAYTRNESFVKNVTNYGSGSKSGITTEAALAASVLKTIDPYDNPGPSPKCVYKLEDFVEYLKGISE